MKKLNKDPHLEEQDTGFEKKEKRRPTFQEIIEAVSRYYSVSVQDMIGPKRNRDILLPRQIAMLLGKKYLNMSYVGIGEVFSNRDHTTVMNAVSKIERKLLNDAQLLREVRAIEEEVGVV